MTDNLEEAPGSDPPPVELAATDEEAPTRPAQWSDVVECAHHAYTISNNWLLVTDRVFGAMRQLGVDPLDTAFDGLRASMAYVLREKRSKAAEVRLERFDPPGAPTMTPKSATTAVKDDWRRLVSEVAHPAARARLLDLLWQAGGPNVPADSAAALDAYLDVATLAPYAVRVEGDNDPENEVNVMWRDRDRDLALGRALTISHVASRTPSGAASADRARKIAMQRLGEYLDDEKPNAGNTLLLLAVLVRQRQALTGSERDSLRQYLDAALTKYAGQDHLVDELCALLVTLRPSERERAQRIRVEARLAIAEDRPPGVRMHFLERAASLARDFGLEELRADATRRMQAIKPDELGLATIRAEFKLPQEVVRGELLRMCEGATWREALSSWLNSGCPTGSVEANRKTADDTNAGSLRRVLRMPTVVLGPDGMPSWTAESEEDERAWELVGVERLRMQVSARFLAESLDRIVLEHGEPDELELTRFLSNDGTGDVELSGAMARSLLRYWRRDFEGSLHTSVPRVEAGARRLVVALDKAAYQVARGNSPGVFAGLPVLLDLLEPLGFDPDWDRFIRCFLLGPAGMSERHHLAHGFNLASDPQGSAALALQAFGLFVVLLWEPTAATAPSTPPDGPVLASSVAGAVGNVVRNVFARQVPFTALLRNEARAARREVEALARAVLARVTPESR